MSDPHPRHPRRSRCPLWSVLLLQLALTPLTHAQVPEPPTLPLETAEAATRPAQRQWQLVPERVHGHIVHPSIGALAARVSGDVAFESVEPRAMQFSGNASARQRVCVTELSAGGTARASLPSEALTVEAWARIETPREWGGLVGVLQDNGDHERGWLLGYRNSRFCFAVKSTHQQRLTYLTAVDEFETGYWYHVVGTYDGSVQRLYVDGRLSAESRDQRGSVDYDPQATFCIGAYEDQNEFYPLRGAIESCALWPAALDANAVQRRFAERKTRFPGIDPVHPTVTDWPTYLRDNQRTGAAQQSLALPLQSVWRFQQRHPPQPAWPDPARQDFWHRKFNLRARVVFDRANHLVAVGNSVYFGSSADDKLYCLDADSGRVRWTFFADGPIRLAPTLVEIPADSGQQTRLLFGSDDGHVYCLDAADGTLEWSIRVAPDDLRIPGNERVISLWPVRTGVLVDNNIAYCCCGIFPEQGVYQVALDVLTGRILDRGQLASSAQGYLERRNGKLFISTGRDPAGAYSAALKRSGKGVHKGLRNLPEKYQYAFVKAGNVRLGGADGEIAAFRESDGQPLWSAPVNGKAWSIAIAGQRVFVSTDRGTVHCFQAASRDGMPGGIQRENEGPTPPAPQAVIPEEKFVNEVTGAFTDAELWPQREHYELSRRAATRMLENLAHRRGYCLVLNCGRGEFVHALLENSEMQVVGVSDDRQVVKTLRRILDASGHYGRASIHYVADLHRLPFTDFLFNLVVDAAPQSAGDRTRVRPEIVRVLRPYGGLYFHGLNDEQPFRRERLAGSGEWTHMYANPANTVCSADELVNGKLRLQWFGRPGPQQMIDRHHRTVAPLFADGRLYIPGNDLVIAADAYNGTQLWQVRIPNSRRVGAYRDCSYLAAAKDLVYVAAGGQCLALNAVSGNVEFKFPLPPMQSLMAKDETRTGSPLPKRKGDTTAVSDPSPRGALSGAGWEWGFLAVQGEWLFGSRVGAGGIRRGHSLAAIHEGTFWDHRPLVCSVELFAHRRHYATDLWTYRPRNGVIVNSSITLGDGRVYFVESQHAETAEPALGRVSPRDLFANPARLVALEATTGHELWSREVDLKNVEHNVYTAYAQGRLLVVGSGNSGTDDKTSRVLYDIHVFEADTGQWQWTRTQDQRTQIDGDHGEQDHHPVIVGQHVYCEPYAYNLISGARLREWNWDPRHRRGCGTISASSNTFFFRHSHARMFDLERNSYDAVTSSTRPGCWINMIPAGGLLLVPEASSGCTCNYAVQTSLAFVPLPDEEPAE